MKPKFYKIYIVFSLIILAGFAYSVKAAYITTPDTTWTLSGTNLFPVSTSYNVGIGTTSPAHPLDVNGNILVRGSNVLFTDYGTTNREYITSNDSGISGLNTLGVFGFFADTSLGGAITSPTAGISAKGIYSNGYVGIGIASPNKQLHVYSTNPNAEIDIQSVLGAGNQWGLYNEITDNSFRIWGGDNYVSIKRDGKIGIGTTNPIGKLFVGSNWRTSHGGTDLYIGSGAGITNTSNLGITYSASSSATAAPSTVGITLYNDDATAGGWSPLLLFSKAESGPTPYKATMAGIAAKTPTGIGSGDSWIDGELHFYTAGTGTNGLVDRMVINKDGNVGIGTTNPQARLDLGGGASGRIVGIDTNPAAVRGDSDVVPKKWIVDNFAPVGTGAGSAFVQGGNSFGTKATLGTNDSQTLAFETAGAERMTILSNGNVGIGTTAPGAKLEVNGNSFFNRIDKIGPASNNPERGVWNPIWSSLSAGRALYADEEFEFGYNSVSAYNNSGGTGVQLFWENGDGTQPNRSGKWIRIVNNGNITSPDLGGFYQSFTCRANATLVQRFRAKLPVGYSLELAENSQGTNNTSYWLTPRAGTGKWEEYIRVSHCGNTGTFSTGGHVKVIGSPAIFTWYLASSNVYEIDSPSGVFSGNVGVGTASPGYKLDTYTPNTLDAYLRVQRQGTTKPVGITLANDTVNTSYLYMPAGRNDLRFYTGGDRMTILNSNGNVGIGTTNPTGTFHVNRNDGSVIFEDGASGQAYFNIDFSNAGSPQIGMSDKGNDNAWAIGTDDSDNSFKIAGGTLTSIPLITSNTKMTILANGNVGIGTTNPQARLDLGGGASGRIVGIDTNPAAVRGDSDVVPKKWIVDNFAPVGTGAGSAFVQGGNSFGTKATLGTNDSQTLAFETAGAERITILSGGNVGIGTTVPSQKLHVVGGVRSDSYQIAADSYHVLPDNLTMPSVIDNALGFRIPVLVEKWDGSTWVNVTAITTWGWLNDNKATQISLMPMAYSANNARIRVYYDMGGQWITPANQLVLTMQHTSYLNYLKVEQADDMAFTANVNTLKELSTQQACGDCALTVPTSGTLWRRYVRIDMDLSQQNAGWEIGLKEIAFNGAPYWGGSRFMGSMIPLDWDYNKNIFVSGNIGIGTASPGYKLDTYTPNTLDAYLRVQRQGTTKPVGITLANDTVNTSYLYMPAGRNDLRFYTGGDRMTILNSNGNVGIGTTDPNSKLHVVGNTYFNGVTSVVHNSKYGLFLQRSNVTAGSENLIRFTGSTNSAYYGAYFGAIRVGAGSNHLVFGTSNNDSTGDNIEERMRITSNGNVGIGTTNPLDKLHVIGDVRVSNLISCSGTGQAIKTDSSGRLVCGSVSGGITGSGTTNYVARWTGTSTLGKGVLYDNGANVGIGTTAANERLTISSGNIKLYSLQNTADAYRYIGTEFNSGNGNNKAEIRFAIDGADTKTRLTFHTANGAGTINEQMRITSTGNVGIGTTAPASRLNISETTGTVHGASTGSLIIDHENSGGASSIVFRSKVNRGSDYGYIQYQDSSTVGAAGELAKLIIGTSNDATDDVVIMPTGSFGINTMSPGYKLDAYTPSTVDAYYRFQRQNTTKAVGLVLSDATVSRWYLQMPTGSNDFHINSGSTNRFTILNSNGYVGIGTTGPTEELHVIGDAKISRSLYASGASLSGNLLLNENDITGVNKLTVMTIDPLYRINGINYSTFAPSFVGGVKEEIAGKIKIEKKVAGEYQAIIDFSKVSLGSDLWVWYNVIDFNKESVEVSLTPYGGFANTYYYIDGKKLVLKADRPVEVSYRLTAKRFDWKEWPTKATDQNETPGFIID